MDASKLYDEDFVLWTEQQARALRELGGSNSLDVVHLAEEVEDLGRRDLREVESLIEQILWHALKLIADPDNDAARHWAGELTGFQSQLRRAFTPSMRQKIDLDAVWGDAMRRFINGPRPSFSDRLADEIRLAELRPVLGDLTATSFDLAGLLAALNPRTPSSAGINPA